jgi:hypothetical protein
MAFFTLFTSWSFLGLFNASVIGTLICLGIDIDLNDDHPVNGPPDLHYKLDKVFQVDREIVETMENVKATKERDASLYK